MRRCKGLLAHCNKKYLTHTYTEACWQIATLATGAAKQIINSDTRVEEARQKEESMKKENANGKVHLFTWILAFALLCAALLCSHTHTQVTVFICISLASLSVGVLCYANSPASVRLNFGRYLASHVCVCVCVWYLWIIRGNNFSALLRQQQTMYFRQSFAYCCT